MCCNQDVAWRSTINRYNLMKHQGLVPRAVTRLKYNEMVENLPDNVDALYRSEEFNEITLWDRDENELYRMTETPYKSPYSIVHSRLLYNYPQAEQSEKKENADEELDLTGQDEHRGR